MAKRLARTTVSCKKGCHACCKQITIVAKAESDLIAKSLVGSKIDLRDLIKRLEESAVLMSQHDDMFDYFCLDKRCAFLDDKNECIVYPVRPAACRYYYVTTSPEECSEPVRGSTITVINTSDLQAEVFCYCLQLQGEPWVSPLPLAVMHSLFRITKDEELGTILKRLPDPQRWMAYRIENPLVGMLESQRKEFRKGLIGAINAFENERPR
jgi:Fe-S-cluster containining protein